MIRRIAAVLAGAALVHVAAIQALPRAIVAVVRHRLSAEVGTNRIQHAPLPDGRWRTVVMPSPDLLYSACAYDVSERPLLVTAEVPQNYWSISAFADDTANFFVENDRAARGGRVRVVFSSRPGFQDPGGGTVVQVPSKTGVVLFRQLVLDRKHLPQALKIQHAATCAPLN
ncbi:MAG TPA: DUF1254 domain-containing protein [Myxococcales bacterium]